MSGRRRISWPVALLIAACAALALADPFIHKHGHFASESWFGFHAWFGFLAFSFVILAGRFLRRLLMRDEDYYDH